MRAVLGKYCNYGAVFLVSFSAVVLNTANTCLTVLAQSIPCCSELLLCLGDISIIYAGFLYELSSDRQKLETEFINTFFLTANAELWLGNVKYSVEAREQRT